MLCLLSEGMVGGKRGAWVSSCRCAERRVEVVKGMCDGRDCVAAKLIDRNLDKSGIDWWIYTSLALSVICEISIRCESKGCTHLLLTLY